MAFTPCGYAQGRAVFSPAEVQELQASITETLDRIARGFLTPFETSCPELPFTERLVRVAQQDRAYASALVHGLLADAQRDPRLAGLMEHSGLLEHVTRLVAPRQIIGHTTRVRVNVPGFPQSRTRWHQDATDDRSTVAVACWIPLVDATVANGTVEAIPGPWDAPIPHRQSEGGGFYVPEELLAGMAPVALPCPAGDVLFLDRFLPHRSLPNRTMQIRWNVVVWVRCSPS